MITVDRMLTLLNLIIVNLFLKLNIFKELDFKYM